eukprot:764408-Hanusia_phi.AAC.2
MDRSIDQEQLKTMIIETVHSRTLFPNIFSRSRPQARTASPELANRADSLVDSKDSQQREGYLFAASSLNESKHPRRADKVRFVREQGFSHAEASQWIVGGPHKKPLLPKLGVGRLHADSFYSSHVPVPLTDYNYTSSEVSRECEAKVRLKSGHRSNSRRSPRSLTLAAPSPCGGAGHQRRKACPVRPRSPSPTSLPFAPPPLCRETLTALAARGLQWSAVQEKPYHHKLLPRVRRSPATSFALLHRLVDSGDPGPARFRARRTDTVDFARFKPLQKFPLDGYFG